MQRSQEVLRKPSSSKPYHTEVNGFFPIEYEIVRPSSNTQYFTNPKPTSIPFNQSSSINFSRGTMQKQSRLIPAPKRSPNRQPLPQKSKVYFSYNPRTLNVERHYIETIIRETEKPFSNQWEQRYFELYKQIHELLIHNQKISQQFLKIREELKNSNQAAIQNSIENFTRTQSYMENNTREETTELRENYQRLKVSLQKSQREASMFKEQNIRRQNMIQKLQSELISQKNLTYKIEIEKNQIANQIIKIEYELKEMTMEKNKLEGEVYDLKMALASKNLQIQQFSLQQHQQPKKYDERSKSPEKMSQQKFQQKLTRIRTQYEKKEKKLQKIIQGKQKQNSDLRKFITQVEQKQRSSRELKQNYEKLYNEKKEQVANLKKIQESLLASQEDQRQIVFYEQRINQLNKLASDQSIKIQQLQKTKSEMSKKIEQYHDNYITQQHLNYLHEVIENKQNKILEEGGINYDELNNKAHSYFNGKVFEEKMIYQLKKDNQRLMELLQKIDLRDFVGKPYVVVQQNFVVNGGSSGISLEMQKMISDIFYKLDRVSQGVKGQSNRSSQMIKSHKDISPPKSKRQKQSPKKSHRRGEDQIRPQSRINYKITKQLDTLKVYIVNLSSTCQKLINQLQKQHQSRIIQQKQQKQSLKTEIKINQMVPKDEQIVDFYKLKNKQLQARVSQLLSLCNSLKQKLCQQRVGENSGENYWKNQVKGTKEELEEFKLRYGKLLSKYQTAQDEKQKFQTKVALFSLEIERLTQLVKQYQDKISGTDDLIPQIQSLRLEKSSLARQLSISEHKIQQLNAKIEQYLKLLNQKQTQNLSLQLHLTQSTKTLQILQSESKQKSTRLDLQTKTTQTLQSEIEQSRKKSQNLQRTIQRLHQQLQTNTSEFQSYKRNSGRFQVEAGELRGRLARTLGELEEERRRIGGMGVEIGEYRNRQDQVTRRYVLLQNQYVRLKNQLEEIKKLNLAFKEKLGSSVAGSSWTFNAFYLEKLRSMVLETEVLVDELSMDSSTRNNQLLTLLHKNFTQILQQISSIPPTSQPQPVPTSTSQSQKYLQKISSLQQKLKQITLTNSYNIQLLRSLLIQFDCLVEEIGTGEGRNREIVGWLKGSLGKGFQCLMKFEV